jgi:hypothetical protein
MALVPVFCDNCGTLFVADNFIGGDAREVSFKNVGFGPCPVCGQAGHVLDGTFDFIGDTIKVLSAPEWSAEKLAWLGQRIEAARAGTVSADQVIDEVSATAPELETLIQQLLRQGWSAIKVLAVLLTLIGFAEQKLDPPANKAAVEVATENALRRLEQHPIAPTTSPPKARPQDRPTRRPKAKKTHGKNKKRKKR